MRFSSPLFLLLLLALPLLGVYFFRISRRRKGSVKYSNAEPLSNVPHSRAYRLRGILPVLRICALALLIFSLARPQFGLHEQIVTSEGIDIMLALDVSESMRAPDFNPNRLEAAKKVIADFIARRKADSIGLVVFASSSFVLGPLTLDYGVIRQLLQDIDFGIVDGNSTAIGMGLAYCVDRLKDRESKSKIIILLTDGTNNAGEIQPETAAEMARAYNVRIYTIGVGSKGTVMMEVDTVFGKRKMPVEVTIDEETLKTIASTTGGRYFRATDNESLENIYEEIDELEKTEIELTEFSNYDELMAYFMIPAILLLLGEAALRSTRYLQIP